MLVGPPVTHRSLNTSVPSRRAIRPEIAAPLGIGKTVDAPAGVTRRTAPAAEFGVAPGRLTASHRLRSGPETIASYFPLTGRGNSVSWPAGVRRATRLRKFSVNQILPSGPAVICAGNVPLGR